jgi:mono/diheme cytochrome c family protein
MRLIALAAALLAGVAPPQDVRPDFDRDIRPLFQAHCISCHGPKKVKGQLRLDVKALAFRGGASGKVILPGKGKESRLVEALRDPNPDDRMPKDAPALGAEKIALIQAWIDAGALWPDDPADGAAKTEKHWAYVKPAKREVPGGLHPIDYFVSAELEARKLPPRPEAPKAVLLRRVYLDLIGLPPTREELGAFLADGSPGAYDRVVDRLLADPRYGERWGRHWMDVWRYSDMSEFEANEILSSQRHLWRWRDWIVDSLNADKGYDRMVTEMLAGDEVAPEDPATLRATGFLARNYYKLNRNVWLDSAVEHTSKAFLATTLNCARCHNHFFDPLLQDEFYQFRAFYEAYDVRTDPVPGQVDPLKDGLARVYDVHVDTPTHLFIRGEERNVDTSRALRPTVPQALSWAPVRIEPVGLPPASTAPGKQEFVRRDLRAAAERTAAEERKKIDAALETIARIERGLASEGDAAKLEKERQAALENLPQALLGAEVAQAASAALAATLEAERIEDGGDRTSETFLAAARRAQASQRTRAVLEARLAQQAARHALVKSADEKKKTEQKKKLSAADEALAKAEAEAAKPVSADFVRRAVPTYPSTSTGRRLALARWIVDRENPIAARVAVNHVWLRHFGRALVPTTFDFGSQGQRPSHPALLDWLAVDFMEHGWSMKRLHRLIVTSAAYRRDSTPDAAALAADPENKYLWRMAPRRLEAEAVRDSVLYVTRRLDLARGGPEIDEGQGLVSRRRSLYFRHNPEKRMEFLAIFDAASATESYTRTPTIVPQQALALLNSALALDAAAELAEALSKTAADDAAFILASFETVLSRPATQSEQEACRAFLGSGKRQNLVHALLNHHEFVTIR